MMLSKTPTPAAKWVLVKNAQITAIEMSRNKHIDIVYGGWGVNSLKNATICQPVQYYLARIVVIKDHMVSSKIIFLSEVYIISSVIRGIFDTSIQTE